MPELPEVERGRLIAESVAVGRTIVRVKCDQKEDIVFCDQSPRTVQNKLRNRRVEAVHRRGKHLFFELDQRPWPLFHFGMTGAFVIPQVEPLNLESTGKKPYDPEEWPPRFTKIHMIFDDGGELVMTNARRLGRIRLRENPLDEAPLNALGFDPLHDLPTPKVFVEQLQSRSALMKALLLDQKFAAGVGNWIADEILYQAKIDPQRRANTLSDAEAKLVRTKLKSVIETAVKVNSDKKRFPKNWLFHQRWGKQEDARTKSGEAIEHVTIGGRTTAWVPSVQR
ncbi:MAG: DNA-formamidopyrimidine glycosylase family protein [Planctomycetota bacterium]